MKIAVCWKWVSLDSEHEADPRWSGVSAADRAALETALRLGPTGSVRVICLGPAMADDVLRDALAVGAAEVLRIDAAANLDSRVVATAIAAHLHDADLVVCGDYSMDRGTGSVPAFLAAELGFAQALGLVDVPTEMAGAADIAGAAEMMTGVIRVTRRLDGGRREILDVATPAVLSVEGSVARLRRASMSAELTARRADVPSVTGPPGHPPDAEVHPYRPRPRTLPTPHGDALSRVRQILDVGGDDARAELVTLDPPAAAARIVAQLREWGYLDPPENG